ncbi:hypothetical protein Vafri_8729 [Volvox africanus]|uniref:Uncharacterized protein n=1 Tax=Volvox africanus TaxID=51714 RepID=A0A8J4B2X1_9CHLO|nr:hypothetical protein Vafri_8729 [Volvox africanus]
MESELTSVGKLNWADEVDELEKTREAEEAAKPSEPPRPPTYGVLLGGVPDDFELWEVDRMMSDLLFSIRVIDRRRVPGQAVYELDLSSREDVDAVCKRLNEIEIQGNRVWARATEGQSGPYGGGYSYGHPTRRPSGRLDTQYSHPGYDAGPYGGGPYGGGRGYGDRQPYGGGGQRDGSLSSHSSFSMGRSDSGPYGRTGSRDFSPPRGGHPPRRSGSREEDWHRGVPGPADRFGGGLPYGGGPRGGGPYGGIRGPFPPPQMEPRYDDPYGPPGGPGRRPPPGAGPDRWQGPGGGDDRWGSRMGAPPPPLHTDLRDVMVARPAAPMPPPPPPPPPLPQYQSMPVIEGGERPRLKLQPRSNSTIAVSASIGEDGFEAAAVETTTAAAGEAALSSPGGAAAGGSSPSSAAAAVAAAMAASAAAAGKPKSNPFGAARPVDTLSREREIEERMARERVGMDFKERAFVSHSSGPLPPPSQAAQGAIALPAVASVPPGPGGLPAGAMVPAGLPPGAPIPLVAMPPPPMPHLIAIDLGAGGGPGGAASAFERLPPGHPHLHSHLLEHAHPGQLMPGALPGVAPTAAAPAPPPPQLAQAAILPMAAVAVPVVLHHHPPPPPPPPPVAMQRSLPHPPPPQQQQQMPPPGLMQPPPPPPQMQQPPPPPHLVQQHQQQMQPPPLGMPYAMDLHQPVQILQRPRPVESAVASDAAPEVAADSQDASAAQKYPTATIPPPRRNCPRSRSNRQMLPRHRRRARAPREPATVLGVVTRAMNQPRLMRRRRRRFWWEMGLGRQWQRQQQL